MARPAARGRCSRGSARIDLERLEELRLTVLEERVDADLSLGRHAALVGELQAVAEQHPYRERLCAQLMPALYRSGRHAEPLEAFGSRASEAQSLGSTRREVRLYGPSAWVTSCGGSAPATDVSG